ncbi:hypothetical protein SEPCBS119000_001262 [Sporothrix epigloea]|uniref:Leucine rich repeat domain containing protein n=1 Tax=Sporothrix epigloea TaxID=1892477 RepID=A0ABP0D9R1_9PEZI
MAARSRQRAAAPAGGWSATSLSLRSSQGHARRHAPALNYAEISESDEDLDEADTEQSQSAGGSDSDVPSAHGNSDSEDGGFGDNSSALRQRPSKRSQPVNVSSPETRSPKRRRQPQRRATAKIVNSDGAYLSPPSEGARRTRRLASTALANASPEKVATKPEASSSLSQKRTSQTGNSRRGIKSPTKQTRKHDTTHKSDGKRTGGKSNGLKVPDHQEAESPLCSNRPPWATLPYLVLAEIFACGAGSLDSIESVRWLVGASRTCKSFTEPALRALYRSPPMLTMNMAHNLVDHLAKDPSTTIYDYRKKVKTLRIDVGSLASHVYRGRHLDIPRLISYCPNLENLDLYHFKDRPPYKEQLLRLRWSYPNSLFEVLGSRPPEGTTQSACDVAREEDGSSVDLVASSTPRKEAFAGVKLKSWRWNHQLMGRDLTLGDISVMHLSPTFAGLCEISLVNYHRASYALVALPDKQKADEVDKKQAEDLADLLNSLPNLTHLSLETSTVADEFFLPLLPKTLKRITLINCSNVLSCNFANYLLTHGQELREVTLNYNQYLNLSFLTVLGTACPQLQVLRMNMTYFVQEDIFNTTDPFYENLMTSEEVPAWPTGIQVIELEYLRKWEPDAAEVFFQSLLDSAPHMPNLRVLTIKAMLNIPWRQRCKIRDRWESAFDRVFKRRETSPEPASSLSYYDRQEKQDESPRGTAKARRTNSKPSRRSHRIATHVDSPSSCASSVSRSLRTKQSRNRVSYREPDTDEDMPSSDDSSEDSEGAEEEEVAGAATQEQGESKHNGATSTRPTNDQEFVHGLCDVVDIRIDNQKPCEIQYSMLDFLDSEHSSLDDEWTEDREDDLDYAW